MINIYTLTRNDILASNCYLLCVGDECAVIDPSVSLDEFKRRFPEIQKYNIKYVFLTHAHADHFIEIMSYLKDGVTVLVSSPDAGALSVGSINLSVFLGEQYCSYSGQYKMLSEGECINLCGVEIKTLYTPGHTPGSITLIVEDKLFTGDTLFSSGGYGRCDLPLGNFSHLKESLKKLLSLPDGYTVYPGHGEAEPLYVSKGYFDLK